MLLLFLTTNTAIVKTTYIRERSIYFLMLGTLMLATLY